MALAQILFGGPKRKGVITPENRITRELGLEFDVLMNEAPEYTANLSRSGVESGASVTDHVELVPVKLSIEGIISATPASLLRAVQGAGFGDPVGDGHRLLKKLRDDREPFDFVGGFETYTSMILTSYQPTRNKDTGLALRFTATMEQVRYATSDTVPAFTQLPAAKPKKSLGVQPAPPASDKALQKWTDIHSTYQGVEPTAGTVNNRLATGNLF